MGRIWEKGSLGNRERKTTNKFRFVLVFLLLLSVGIAFIGITSATTIHVPDDYPTIQQAVDNAMDGDTIIVHSGTYHEHVSIHKSLTIIGEGAIIDAGGEFCCLSMCLVTSGNVRGFTVQNGAIGIDLSHASNVNVEDNTALNNLVGFNIWDSNNNNIKNNVAQGSEYSGISIHGGYGYGGSSYNTITDNELSNNDMGIDIYTSSNHNEIINNIIMSNKYEGIHIRDSCNSNTITNNELSNNDVGIYIEDSGNNLIHHNNLINNSQNAYDDMGNNFWDNGYPSGGNYWSDYIGTDTDGDGIGDTPYNISGGAGAQDRYPFMQMNGWLHIILPDAVGVYDNEGTWALWNTATSSADIVGFGWANTIPVVGDWDGDGYDTVGVYNTGGDNFLIQTDTGFDVIGLGWSGVTPVVGDWNGDGYDTVGVYNNEGNWALWNTSLGDADIVGFGWSNTTPVVGDWDGDGAVEVGIYNIDGNNFLIQTDTGFDVIGLGWAGVTPVVGDWNGDGYDTVGVYNNEGNWALWNTSLGDADIVGFGWSDTTPVVGDWDGDGTDEVGIYNTGGNNFLIQTDVGFDVIGLGWEGVTPVVGIWS